MVSIDKIIRNDLCLGCGLCEAVDSQCKMRLTPKGFYHPSPAPTDEAAVRRLNHLCPAISIKSDLGNNTSIWGCVKRVANAWASQPDVRHSSSSGGVVSALAIYLLEAGKVDGVLHVATTPDHYLYNSLQVSLTRDDVLRRNASRYAPALVFNDFFRILQQYKEQRFAFIGKPCDIAALRNLQRENPELAARIPYCLSIFCAGMPSYEATHEAIATFAHPAEPVALRYRGDGWPGLFRVDYADGETRTMTYNESWGKILGRRLGFRCKICPDGIGMLADIATGDAWHTRNGYPDFTEAEGRNFCFVRTQRGLDLFNAAIEAGYITSEALNIDDVRHMQAYQYNRRHYVGWSIAVVQMMTGGMLRFRGLNYGRVAMRANLRKALSYAKGTLVRFLKLKSHGE